MNKLPLPCHLFLLFAFLSLACSSSGGIGTSGAPLSTGSANEEFVFYSDSVYYWIDSHTAERKSLSASERLPNLTDGLTQPHYLVSNVIITSSGQFISFDRMNGVIAPEGYRLAYVAEEGLYTQYINGADITRIAADGLEPLWHPTGESLVFRQGSELVITGPAGENRQQLLSGQSPRPLAWSPDGTQLLYQDGTALAVITVATGQQRPLTVTANQLSLPPQWLPDGQTLVAGSQGAAGTKLVTIDTNSSQMADLIVWDKPINGFALSPKDGRIAFWAETCRMRQSDLFFWTRYEECRNRLHVADSTGRRIREFDNSNNTNNPPLLSWAVRQLPPATIPQPDPAVTAPRPASTAAPAATPTPMLLPPPTPPPDGYSISRPFAYGTAAQAGQWVYRVEEVLRGQAALDWLLAAGKTPRLEAGEEYVLVKTAVSAPTATDDQMLEFSLFGLTGSQRIIYRRISGLLESFQEQNWPVPAGETTTGWLAFAIPEAESDLLLLLRESLGQPPAYLALTPSAALPPVNNHQPDDAQGTTVTAPVPAGEQFVADSWAITVLDAAYGQAAEAILMDNSHTYRPPEDGFAYLAVHLRLENVDSEDRARWIEARRFELLNEHSARVAPNTIRLFLKQPLATYIFAGGHQEAWVVWHVATPANPDWQPTTLYFEENIVIRGNGRYLALP